jgi:hypothetical protein
MKHTKSYEQYLRIEFPPEIFTFLSKIEETWNTIDNIGRLESERLSQYINLDLFVSKNFLYPFTLATLYWTNPHILIQFHGVGTLSFLFDEYPNILPYYKFLEENIPRKFELDQIPEIVKNFNKEHFNFIEKIYKYNL